MSDNKNDKKKSYSIKDAAVQNATNEIVNRYGSAIKEHIVGYSGIDNQTGQELTKSLKSISKQKINPDYKAQNLKQQSGFSAEVKEVSRSNAENIISGNGNRKARTDDLGRVNDPLYDHVELDVNGNIISGSGSQMKFVGNSPNECLKSLASKKFEKYLDADAKIDIPKDYYEDVILAADKKIQSLDKQIENQKSQGNTEQVNQLKKQRNKYNKIKKNVRKSKETSKEALFAREHPELSTAADITKLSHRAGMDGAKYGAAIGGTVSLVTNVVAVVKGDKDPQEALCDLGMDTAKSAVSGYGISFAGSALKGAMSNAGSATLRQLSATSLPGVVVQTAISTTKTISKYIQGELSGIECFEEMGQNGAEMISGAVFATIGQVIIPIPVLGGVIGGILGYALASASYGTLISTLKDAKLAHEERLRIEKECNEQIQLIKQYRQELETQINQYLTDGIAIFHDACDDLKNTLDIGDIDGFIGSANTITEALGMETQFSTIDEFEALMDSSFTFKL